jgi:hypothetical protein
MCRATLGTAINGRWVAGSEPGTGGRQICMAHYHGDTATEESRIGGGVTVEGEGVMAGGSGVMMGGGSSHANDRLASSIGGHLDCIETT